MIYDNLWDALLLRRLVGTLGPSSLLPYHSQIAGGHELCCASAAVPFCNMLLLNLHASCKGSLLRACPCAVRNVTQAAML